MLIGLTPRIPSIPSSDDKLAGMVVSMQHRRRSGREVQETFVLPPLDSHAKVILLEDHAHIRKMDEGGDDGEQDDLAHSTFKLGLTEKERRDREGVVLPYFDAQRKGRGEAGDVDVGIGEGGRIVYEMGVEDDFDEEEDEI